MSLVSARKNAGLSQKDLSALLGISQSAVALWEKGKTSPRAATLVELADLYGVTIDELIGKEERHDAR